MKLTALRTIMTTQAKQNHKLVLFLVFVFVFLFFFFQENTITRIWKNGKEGMGSLMLTQYISKRISLQESDMESKHIFIKQD